MPEVCEIVITAQYLLTKLKGRYITGAKILSGRYTHQKLVGFDLIDKFSPLKINDINSKGKFMWFELLYEKENINVYLLNTFGMAGSWGFKLDPSNRIEFSITNNDRSKNYTLYYTDPRNFGTLKLTTNYDDLLNKYNSLGTDLLKTEFTDQDFVNWVHDFKYKDKEIIKVLMNQEKNKGLGSGLGNYLAPEILYMAKISPFRTIQSLSNDDIIQLSKSIKYILKLCYTNNKTGYMVLFNNFIDKHKIGIKNHKYPDYHKDIHIGDNTEFEFSVYRKTKDPLGNPVKNDKIIDDRSTYWVPNIQK